MAKDVAIHKGTLDKGAPDKRALPDQSQRSYITRGLAELVPGLTRAVYKKRAPSTALLMPDWPAIVGPRLAMETEPRRLSGTQLTIACSGPMAMELQHQASTLIERINSHAGRRLVERLRFVQENIAPPRPPQRRRAAAPEPIAGIEAGPLHDALARLGASIRSS